MAGIQRFGARPSQQPPPAQLQQVSSTQRSGISRFGAQPVSTTTPVAKTSPTPAAATVNTPKVAVAAPVSAPQLQPSTRPISATLGTRINTTA